MRKLLLLMVAVMSAVLLLSTTAFAVRDPVLSPTEEEVEIDDANTPLSDLELTDAPDEFELEELDEMYVPLSGVPSPQTGVTGLSSTETMMVLAVALAAGGGMMLVKARKQVR